MRARATGADFSSQGCDSDERSFGSDMAYRLKIDWILFATVLVMMLFGVLVLYSASSIMATLDSRYGSSWYFVIRQAGWAVVSVAVMMALKRIPYRNFQNPAVAFGAISVAI